MIILSLIAAFLIAFATGYFIVSLIDRELELRFRLLFAIPVGYGIHSILYFVYQCLNIYNFKDFQWLELIVALIFAIIYYNQDRPDMSKHNFKKLSNWFYVANLYALMIFLKYFVNNPMGSWDGFRIWNTKAEFLFLQNPLWKNVFTLPHFMSHCDYPLFLPSSMARLWHYAGYQNFWTNMIFGLIFTFGLVYLLYQALSYFKSEKVAIAVCTVFMVSDIFLVNGASQCADIPLAMYFLCSIICLFFYFKSKRFTTLLLGLLIAGLSVWVKNEGMMFFAIFVLTIISGFVSEKKYKKSLIFALYSLPFFACAFLYKKFSGAPNDLIYGFFEIKSYAFAFDLHRYAVILKTFISMVFDKFVLFLALALLCVKGFKLRDKIKKPFIVSAIIFILMIAGYVAVYVLAPHDINWLVENSMDRLILQILPVFLFIFPTTLRIGKPDSIN